MCKADLYAIIAAAVVLMMLLIINIDGDIGPYP